MKFIFFGRGFNLEIFLNLQGSEFIQTLLFIYNHLAKFVVYKSWTRSALLKGTSKCFLVSSITCRNEEAIEWVWFEYKLSLFCGKTKHQATPTNWFFALTGDFHLPMLAASLSRLGLRWPRRVRPTSAIQSRSVTGKADRSGKADRPKQKPIGPRKSRSATALNSELPLIRRNIEINIY